MTGALVRDAASEVYGRPVPPPWIKWGMIAAVVAGLLDGKTNLRFPLEKNEQIFGFGLNFKTIHQRGRVLELQDCEIRRINTTFRCEHFLTCGSAIVLGIAAESNKSYRFCKMKAMKRK